MSLASHVPSWQMAWSLILLLLTTAKATSEIVNEVSASAPHIGHVTGKRTVASCIFADTRPNKRPIPYSLCHTKYNCRNWRCAPSLSNDLAERARLTRAVPALALRAPSPRRSGVQNRSRRFCRTRDLAERARFELAKAREALPVFKTGAFNRSATSPLSSKSISCDRSCGTIILVFWGSMFPFCFHPAPSIALSPSANRDRSPRHHHVDHLRVLKRQVIGRIIVGSPRTHGVCFVIICFMVIVNLSDTSSSRQKPLD